MLTWKPYAEGSFDHFDSCWVLGCNGPTDMLVGASSLAIGHPPRPSGICGKHLHEGVAAVKAEGLPKSNNPITEIIERKVAMERAAAFEARCEAAPDPEPALTWSALHKGFEALGWSAVEAQGTHYFIPPDRSLASLTYPGDSDLTMVRMVLDALTPAPV